MKLIRLELSNFCQHESRVIDFTRGLSGILGSNGSGKSNLIQGLIYAITGTVTNNLDQYIRKGSDGNCWVKLTFKSDLTDMTYTIKRGIKPRRSEFTCVETGCTIRKAKEIDAYLIDTLNIDFNIIKNVLTVSQEDFVSFFRSTPAARADVLTRLFGFTELKTARESMRELLLETKDENDHSAKLKVYQEMLTMNEQQLEPFKSLPSRDELMAEYNAFDEYQKKHADIMAAHSTLTYLDQTLEQAQESLKTYMDEKAEIERRYSGKPVDPREVNELTAKTTKITEDFNALSKFYSTFVQPILGLQQDYIQEYTAFSEKEPAIDDTEYLNLQNQLAVVRKQIEDLQLCVPTGRCPTCGQEFPNLQEHLDHLTAEYTALNADYIQKTQYRNEYNEQKEKLMKTWNLFKHSYGTIKMQTDSGYGYTLPQEVQLVFSQFPPISEPLNDWVNSLYEVVREFESRKASYEADLSLLTFQMEQNRELDNMLGRVNQDIAGAENTISAVEHKKAEIQATIPSDFMSMEDAKRQKEANEVKMKEYFDKFAILDRRDVLYKEREELQRKIESVEQLAKKDEEKSKLRANIAAACQVLSSDAFPKYVMIGLLEMLTGNINYYLTTFNAPFTVRIDNSSTELYCEFQNGNTFVASELSGGQKMVLAISWRLALHNTFATEESCGFLTLDEPTNHLDEGNIQNLTQVMAQVKQAAKDKNLQVLVITHEKALEPLFDSVIRL